MNPNDIIFQAFTNLTGGLIDDMTTAVIGLVGIIMIMVGFNKLKLIFDSRIDSKLDGFMKERNLGKQYEDYENSQLIKIKFNRKFKKFEGL
ncbi:MAG: hypothetical protein KKB30_09970 [Proteobacteria bacterium]|nr:hypothetical protein [Pseudomonadota bacterium]MBU1716377.1 hypothetical protein [Pseudomonadota bacterium]